MLAEVPLYEFTVQGKEISFAVLEIITSIELANFLINFRSFLIIKYQIILQQHIEGIACAVNNKKTKNKI